MDCGLRLLLETEQPPDWSAGHGLPTPGARLHSTPAASCLPPHQDLKDHMREVGDVGYSDVQHSRDGNVGIVEYGSQADLDTAIRKLDRSIFK